MTREDDKTLSKLYLARSEGKTIQQRDAICNWHDKNDYSPINSHDRIKPQTVEEAAIEFVGSDSMTVERATERQAFHAGARWQKDQDNE